MSNSNLETILKEYEKKRLDSIYDADNRKKVLYSNYPRLQEIDDTLGKEAIRLSKLMILNNDKNLLDELNTKISSLKKEKDMILKSLGKDLDYLKPIFECKDCSDTGYIIQNNETKMCHCLKQKLLDLEYNDSNIYNLKTQTFDNFLLDYYSDEVDEQKYNSKISPRENIEKIKKLAMRFIENFDSEKEKNLVFTGNTGLRKIFFIWLYCK